MSWTKNKPTVDGFYWMNGKTRITINQTESFSEVVLIKTEGSERYLYFAGDEVEKNLDAVKEAYFWGPLEIPRNAPLQNYSGDKND